MTQGRAQKSVNDQLVCQNCDLVIDRLGEAFVWLDRPVCKSCFKRLAATRSVRYRAFWMPVALVSLAVAITLGVLIATGTFGSTGDPQGLDETLQSGDSSVHRSKVFIADLEEKDCKIWLYGKKGWGASMGRLRIDGTYTPNGIGMHPSQGQTGYASYELPGSFKQFRSQVGINDSAEGNPKSPITFKVLGDGKVLWESQPISRRKERHDVSVDITGVKLIRLQISVSGDHTDAHAVWFEPCVVR